METYTDSEVREMIARVYNRRMECKVIELRDKLCSDKRTTMESAWKEYKHIAEIGLGFVAAPMDMLRILNKDEFIAEMKK
jgi:hypothetical protein